MAEISKKLVILLVIVQVLLQCTSVESKPKPGKGQGKAFGAGILAGGIAGAAIGHVLTRPNAPTEVHHYHQNVDPNAGIPAPVPQARPSTIIERGETLPNGCYKQTIKEPDYYDVTRFTETEQLICPPNVQAPPAYIHPAPIPQPPPPVYVPAPQPPPPVYVPVMPQQPPAPQPDTPTHHFVPNYPVTPETSPHPPNIHDPTQFPPLAPAQPVPSAPILPGQPPAEQPNPAVVIQHPQPGAPGLPTTSVTSQVIVLSKKTGYYADDNKKKNGANKLLKTNYVLMLLVALSIFSL